MFHYKKGLLKSFTDLAEWHYEELNPKRGSAGNRIPKAGSLQYRIKKLAQKKGVHQDFFKDLAAQNFALLKKIITGNPQELTAVVEQIDANITSGRYPKMTNLKGKKIVLSAFGKKLVKVFDYDAFVKFNEETPAGIPYGAYPLAEALSINVCVYCNRNYTFTVNEKGKEKRVRPEFDHFLPQSKYPYLALSFYNLIPSCHICNSNLKHKEEFTYDANLHPYAFSFDDALCFTVKLNSPKTKNTVREIKGSGAAFFYGDLQSFYLDWKVKLAPQSKLCRRSKANAKTFLLLELYNRHRDMVVEMIQNCIVYNETYIQDLLKYRGTLFRNREDVLRLITKNYPLPDSMPDRAFSKLSRDIHMEFGLHY